MSLNRQVHLASSDGRKAENFSFTSLRWVRGGECTSKRAFVPDGSIQTVHIPDTLPLAFNWFSSQISAVVWLPGTDIS